ncbi:MAG: acyl-carrier-protein phosphodiesterase [bacterium]|nr:MAG: acyl-carrier-protein phosphodiesterase [bacterium]
MKISIVTGSHRKDSQSAKVGKHLQKRLLALDLCENVYLLDLGNHDIPFWDEGIWQGEEKWQRVWKPIEKELDESDAFIFVSPEWSGMVPAKLKNFFLLTPPNVVGHKPALIVAVSAATGGSFPVGELRVSSYKNNRICYIPEHIIVRNVAEVLNEAEDLNNKSDVYLRGRIDFTLSLLKQYAIALKSVRENEIDYKKYPFGM